MRHAPAPKFVAHLAASLLRNAAALPRTGFDLMLQRARSNEAARLAGILPTLTPDPIGLRISQDDAGAAMSCNDPDGLG